LTVFSAVYSSYYDQIVQRNPPFSHGNVNFSLSLRSQNTKESDSPPGFSDSHLEKFPGPLHSFKGDFPEHPRTLNPDPAFVYTHSELILMVKRATSVGLSPKVRHMFTYFPRLGLRTFSTQSPIKDEEKPSTEFCPKG